MSDHPSRKIIIPRKIIIHHLSPSGKPTVGYIDKNTLSRLCDCPDTLKIGNDRFLKFGPLLVVTDASHLEAGENEDQQRGRGETDKKTAAEQPGQARQPH